MNGDVAFCWSVAVCITSVAGCVAVGDYARNTAAAKKDPRTACVERALFQADRIACLTAPMAELK